ncbi:hypothetical protein EHI44_17875 [Rhizobium leguminosarum]|nr:hypothetical protein EHI44_17875 [Rhizobium leguminosarum]
MRAPILGREPIEHDAEKCERFFGRHHALIIELEQDSDFRPVRPKSSCSSADALRHDPMSGATLP